jgi:hypothetical protein
MMGVNTMGTFIYFTDEQKRRANPSIWRSFLLAGVKSLPAQDGSTD